MTKKMINIYIILIFLNKINNFKIKILPKYSNFFFFTPFIFSKFYSVLHEYIRILTYISRYDYVIWL